jgi:hypothetical protein
MTAVPDDIYIQRDVGGARLLRFSTTVMNVGRGPLELIGEMDAEGGHVNVTQVIQQREGDPVERQAGRLVRSVEHAHWHLESFALFELWPYEDVIVESLFSQAPLTQNKITFCLLDEIRVEPENEYGVENPQFYHCGWETQGISAGWQETYIATLPGQYLDITNLPDGEDIFRVTLDPDNLLQEMDPANNGIAVVLRIGNDTVEVIEEL